MKCVYCGDDNGTRKHEGYCPYNPKNIKIIAYWLKNYVETKSMFNKKLKPFPSSKELDAFLEQERIMRFKTIKRRYLSTEGIKLEDWLSQLISIGLENSILREEDFPVHILYVWDTWLFKSSAEYSRCYKMAIDYENSNHKVVDSKDFEPFVLKG